MEVALRARPRPVTPAVSHLDPATQLARSEWRVALIAMPFQDPFRPSIQIGLLKAIVASHGFPSDTFHLNLDLAAVVPDSLDGVLFAAGEQSRGLGDWLFSVAAFGDAAPDPNGSFLRECLDRIGLTDRELTALKAFRDRGVDEYLDRILDQVEWSRYRVAGFTSTFAQTVPSLALALRVKRRWPELIVVFGGSNLDGAMGMELVRSMPCIDYGVSGEGDITFTELLVALSEGRDPAGLPGVLCRRDGVLVEPAPALPFSRLDDLPTPDYREYFERAERLGIVDRHGRHQIWLPTESSRGCWWGAKHHCTFCGLNGLTMLHRSKSAIRVRDELADLAAQTGSLRFCFVDNIMDTKYFDELFPTLADDGVDYRIFFAVKANMTREQLRRLRDGGVRRIQPGIESLSSHVLDLMRKGVRASQNVNFLRWARFYGIEVAWNMIFGFPKETLDDCSEQTSLLSKLLHLDPPAAASRIWMERFSPIFEDRATFPAKSVAPERELQFIYPRDFDLSQLAYVFDYELEDTLPDSAFEGIIKAVETWKEADAREVRPSLTLHRAPDFIQIVDGRDPEMVSVHTFEGALAKLYEAVMEKPHSAKMVVESTGLPQGVAEVEDALNEFVARDLMMRDGQLFLSLALPASLSLPRTVY